MDQPLKGNRSVHQGWINIGIDTKTICSLVIDFADLLLGALQECDAARAAAVVGPCAPKLLEVIYTVGVV